jgi:hypothetical protein
MKDDQLTFAQQNLNWNADPNVPNPIAHVEGADVLLKFFLNSSIYDAFSEGDAGVLRFRDVERYRLGGTNDEGWYLGQCRFSAVAPAWGEFYKITGNDALLQQPTDWKRISQYQQHAQHFLFYFRDETFECRCRDWIFEQIEANALMRLPKSQRESNGGQ